MLEGKREALRQAMVFELSREEHLAVLLNSYEGMTVAEIAAVMEVQERQALTVLLRARRKLRAALKRFEI